MNLKKKILIAGAGQLGFRHIQGAVSSPRVGEVWVYEVSEKRIDELKTIFTDQKNPDVRFSSNLDNIPSDIDMAIVSTGANVRLHVVKSILKKTIPPFWILEKILFQSPSEVSEWLHLSVQGSRYWVNTFFRTVPMFMDIKKEFQGKFPSNVYVSGGNWGLICNCIHFVDFCEWFFESSVMEINLAQLSHDWEPAKRIGNYETFGSIEVKFKNGSRLSMDCDKSSDPFVIEIQSENQHWVINWNENCAKSRDGRRIDTGIPFQSQMTPQLIDEILSTEDCGLPSLSDSVIQHREMVSALLNHWNRSRHSNDTSIPIT